MFNHASTTSRPSRKPIFRVEHLEPRALLTVMPPVAQTFHGPSLADLKEAAFDGRNTAQAGIDRMLNALQSQINSGPVADLSADRVDNPGFATEVASLVTSFNANVDQQLLPRFPNCDQIIKLQGARLEADLNAVNAQSTAGLLSGTAATTAGQAAIASLTSGSLQPLNTPLSAFVTRTQTFESDLNTLSQSLNAGATPALSVAKVETVFQAEAEAYRAAIAASLSVTQPTAASAVDAAITDLENQVKTIAQSGTTNSSAQTQLKAAVSTFDSRVVGSTGVFSSNGSFHPGARESRNED